MPLQSDRVSWTEQDPLQTLPVTADSVSLTTVTGCATRRWGRLWRMETWDAIRARRNVRAYDHRPIPAADLDRVLEAGRRAPSSRNQQRWDFVVGTDRDQLRQLAEVWRGARHVADSAATVGLVTTASGDWSVAYDLGQVTMSMMLAAADLGIGSGHAAVQDQELARRLLGFPADRQLAWLIAFGYPAGRPLRPIDRPDRRSFDDVVHLGGW
jgi:nitroreductase